MSPSWKKFFDSIPNPAHLPTSAAYPVNALNGSANSSQHNSKKTSHSLLDIFLGRDITLKHFIKSINFKTLECNTPEKVDLRIPTGGQVHAKLTAFPEQYNNEVILGETKIIEDYLHVVKSIKGLFVTLTKYKINTTDLVAYALKDADPEYTKQFEKEFVGENKKQQPDFSQHTEVQKNFIKHIQEMYLLRVEHGDKIDRALESREKPVVHGNQLDNILSHFIRPVKDLIVCATFNLNALVSGHIKTFSVTGDAQKTEFVPKPKKID